MTSTTQTAAETIAEYAERTARKTAAIGQAQRDAREAREKIGKLWRKLFGRAEARMADPAELRAIASQGEELHHEQGYDRATDTDYCTTTVRTPKAIFLLDFVRYEATSLKRTPARDALLGEWIAARRERDEREEAAREAIEV